MRVEAIKDQTENALQLRAEQFMRAQQIAANTDYIELTTYPKFNRLFALGMLFPVETSPKTVEKL